MFKFRLLFVYYILIDSTGVFCKPAAGKCVTKCCKNDPAIKILQEYLKIDTSREENLSQSVAFWRQQASAIGLPLFVYYPDGKPICVITWTGTNSSLPSIMLNSHADVVPVEINRWTYPPFSGYIDENCNIYGRGTQDTKSLTIQYLEAIRKLKQDNVTLTRTLHITIMPDEETGGYHGIKPFVKTKEFEGLNIGFALDEAITSPDDVISASYQDKRPWQMKFTVFGEAGHGSELPKVTAMEKMYKLFRRIMKFRAEQQQLSKQVDKSDYGAYTTANINMIKGGTATNIIASEVTAVVDMRLGVDVDVSTAQAMVESWRTKAGNDTLLEFIRRDVMSAATPLKLNPYWDVMLQTAKDLDIKVKPIVLPATSDMLVLRNMGIPAIGFAPKVCTPSLMHAKDEYLPVEIFMKGIDIYVELLKNLGNMPDIPNKIC